MTASSTFINYHTLKGIEHNLLPQKNQEPFLIFSKGGLVTRLTPSYRKLLCTRYTCVRHREVLQLLLLAVRTTQSDSCGGELGMIEANKVVIAPGAWVQCNYIECFLCRAPSNGS